MLGLGGIFGMPLIPYFFYSYFFQTILDWVHEYYPDGNIDLSNYKGFTKLSGVSEITIDKVLLVRYVVIPYIIMYLIDTLFIDQRHVQVKNAIAVQTRNFVEEACKEFFQVIEHYFPISVIPWSKDAKLPSTEQYIFAVHPHGIHCVPLGIFSMHRSAFSKRFPNLVEHTLTGLAASVIFKIPLVRELFITFGYVDASRSVAQNAMRCGRSLFVCTGGNEEAMLTTYGEDIVVLKNRKGFIRLALSYGANLVPIYGVGNTDLYKTYGIFLKQRMWIQKKFGIALPIFHGRWFSPLPYKKPLKILIGKPIQTPKPYILGAKPDNALVDKYHQIYMDALKQLYSDHVKDRELQIR